MHPLCADQGIGVIPWSPLARGRLTRDWNEETARSETDEFGKSLYSERGDQAIVERVAEVAAERGVSAGPGGAGLGAVQAGGQRADRRRHQGRPPRRRRRRGRPPAHRRGDRAAGGALHAARRRRLLRSGGGVPPARPPAPGCPAPPPGWPRRRSPATTPSASTGRRRRSRRSGRRRPASPRTPRTRWPGARGTTRSATSALTVESCTPTAAPHTRIAGTASRQRAAERQRRDHGDEHRQPQQHPRAQPVVDLAGARAPPGPGRHRRGVEQRCGGDGHQVPLDQREADQAERHQPRRAQGGADGEPAGTAAAAASRRDPAGAAAGAG